MGERMTLASRAAAPPPKRKTQCSIGKLPLDDTERDALEALLADEAWTDPMVVAALFEEGHTASEQMLGKHRRRRCSCFS